ncbi:MAG: glycosyltransferase, partial [Alicyclobacillus sp.]|nr:glycosyltransferase [Alicyclobacillus sp.]
MQLSLIIPTFNERDNVRPLLTRILAALSDAGLTEEDVEIWFVDDSTDQTPEVLAELAARHPCVHVFHRTAARGLGTAVVEGFHRSSGKYLVVMDADLQHPPELLPTILRRLQEGIDIEIPSRFV